MKFNYDCYTAEDLKQVKFPELKKYFSELKKYMKSELVLPVLMEDISYMHSLLEEAENLKNLIWINLYNKDTSMKLTQEQAEKLIDFAEAIINFYKLKIADFIGIDSYKKFFMKKTLENKND